MEFFEVATTQRAMRRLKPDPIPETVLQKILDAAICAPSGGNRQGWNFLVIRDAATKARLADLYRDGLAEVAKIPYYRDAAMAPPDSPTGRMIASAMHLAMNLEHAPVLILACVAKDGAPASIMTGASIYPAVQNILLAARAQGVGSCLTTVHKAHEAEVKELLGIPDDVETAALIPLGYPLGTFGRPPRRPLGEVTFAERWGTPIGW